MSSNKGTKASVLYLCATLFNKGITFITVPIFTRLLSTSDYGIVNTFTSWVDILTVLLSLALYMAIRVAIVDLKNEKIEFLNTILTFTFYLSTVLCVIVIFAGQFFNINILLVVLAIIQGSASAILMDYTQYLMMEMQYVKRTVYMAMPNCLSIILSIISILYFYNDKLYFGRIIPTIVVYVFFEAIILIRIYSFNRPVVKKSHLKYGLAISLPLVLHGVALNVLSQSDRSMITWLADPSETGIYSLVYNFGMVANVITTALEGIWIPWFMNKLKEYAIDEINQRANDYVKLITYAMLAVILTGPEVLKILASKQYWEGISIIPPIVLSNYFIFIYTLYVNVEHFYKKTINITINTIVAAFFNIIINYIFIPYFGYIAAAYTTLASYILAMILHVKCTKKIVKEIYPLRIFMESIELLGVVTLIYYMLIEEWILRWIILAVIIIFNVIKERKAILSYIRY